MLLIGYYEKAASSRIIGDSTCLKRDCLLLTLTRSSGATSFGAVGLHDFTQRLTSAPIKVYRFWIGLRTV